MPRARPDTVSLVAAAVLLALGVLLLLDAGDVLELTFAVLAPAACAAVGSILLARGLARQR